MTATALDAPIDLGVALTELFRSDPAAMADPYPLWNHLRDTAPFYNHNGTILISDRKSVRAMIDHPNGTHGLFAAGSQAQNVFRSLTPEQQTAFREVAAFEGMYLSRTDGTVHARLRRIAERTFTPRRITQIRDKIEQTSERLLDEIAVEPVIDVMRFAYRLPLIIIGDMLGVPEEDLELIHSWSSRLGRNRRGSDATVMLDAYAAMQDFRAYVQAQIATLKKRVRSEDDISLLGDLLDAEQGEILTEEELTAMYVMLIFAGHETTTNLIGSGLLALLQQGQWDRIVEAPDLIPNAVEELLRFVSPVQWVNRVLAEDMDIQGVKVPAYSTVLLMIAAANRDPDGLAEPNRLDITRRGVRNHFAFGVGSHFCLGSPLARMEAAIALQTLARRFPGLALASDRLAWGGNAMLRGLVQLPIRLYRES